MSRRTRPRTGRLLDERRAGSRGRRAQSAVVGVAVLLGITALSLGVLTAGAGTLVEGHVAATDATRVADELATALDRTAEGPATSRLEFAVGHLRTEGRTVRLLNDTGTVLQREVGAVVYVAGDHRVTFADGAVIHRTAAGATVRTPPSVTAAEGTLLVGLSALNASGPDRIDAGGATTASLRTNLTDRRRSLSNGTYRLAVETTAPGAWERELDDGAAEVTRRDFDGDGLQSVVARYPDVDRGYVVLRDLRLEVTRG